jgi:CelD/BcsL family acetyltransferase involved in cellulose biosynthesis
MKSRMTSQTWSSFPSSGDTVAKRLGPFPFRPFLETVWRHRSGPDAELVVAADGENTVALSVKGTHISFAGQENLTDYHSPVGGAFGALLIDTLTAHRGHSYRFDSMPMEVADIVSESLDSLGAPSTPTQHDAAAVLSLPSSTEEWLASLKKKERHEVRRKRRRLEETLGAPRVERMGADAVGRFCEMHRSSAGDKGAFMTAKMQAFFADLTTAADATVHGLMCDGIMVAAAFGFETDDGYFYYNSAYDVEAAASSPGIVLVASMVEAQIERGAKVVDFLKGDERYKFRMGAVSRPLFMIEGRLP